MKIATPKDEAAAWHIPGGKYDTIDTWHGGADTTRDGGIAVPTETVTIDPIGNAAWIHEGNSWRHQETKRRGQSYDRRDVTSLLSSVSSTTPRAIETFVPTSTDIPRDRYLSRASAKIPKNRTERDDHPCAPRESRGGHREMWGTTREAELHAWRGKTADASNYGRMPAIRKMLDEGRFPDKSADVIQREMLEAQQRVTNRMNDRSGQPDHGKAC